MPSRERIEVTSCPVCHGHRFYPVRGVELLSVVRCPSCGVQLSNPQPSDDELAEIYGPSYFLSGDEIDDPDHVARLKQATADRYCQMIERSGATKGRRLLALGCGHGDFLLAAKSRGFVCTGVEYSQHACEITRARIGEDTEIICGDASAVSGQADSFDVCVMCDVIEHVRRPDELLHQILTLLKPGGLLLLATPSLDSWSARLLRSRWMEYKPEHLTYFSRPTLQRLIVNGGFEFLEHRRGLKTLSLNYISAHFQRFPVVGITPLLTVICRILPASLRRRSFSVVASGVVALARKPETVADGASPSGL